MAGFRPALQTVMKSQCHCCLASSSETERKDKREFGDCCPDHLISPGDAEGHCLEAGFL